MPNAEDNTEKTIAEPNKGGVRLVDPASGNRLQPHHGCMLHHGDTFFPGNPDHFFRIK